MFIAYAPVLPLTPVGMCATFYTIVRNLGAMFDKNLSLTSHVNP